MATNFDSLPNGKVFKHNDILFVKQDNYFAVDRLGAKWIFPGAEIIFINN